MDWQKVKQLLEKYYEGNTSAEEEADLESRLTGNAVPEEFTIDREFFLMRRNERQKSQESAIDWESLIDDLPLDDNRRTLHLKRGHWISVAASILLMIGVSLLMRASNKHFAVDSYKSPELAYEQSKAVLILISQTMNQSMEPLENIKKLEGSLNELQKLQVIEIVHPKRKIQ